MRAINIKMKAVRRSVAAIRSPLDPCEAGNSASGMLSDVAIVFAPPGIHGGARGSLPTLHRPPALTDRAMPIDNAPRRHAVSIVPNCGKRKRVRALSAEFFEELVWAERKIGPEYQGLSRMVEPLMPPLGLAGPPRAAGAWAGRIRLVPPIFPEAGRPAVASGTGCRSASPAGLAPTTALPGALGTCSPPAPSMELDAGSWIVTGMPMALRVTVLAGAVTGGLCEICGTLGFTPASFVPGTLSGNLLVSFPSGASLGGGLVSPFDAAPPGSAGVCGAVFIPLPGALLDAVVLPSVLPADLPSLLPCPSPLPCPCPPLAMAGCVSAMPAKPSSSIKHQRCNTRVTFRLRS